MNTITVLLLIGVVFATAFACRWLLKDAREHRIALCNIGEGTFAEGRVSKLADAAVTTRYLLAKEGSDADHFDICGAANRPWGVITDEAAIGDMVNLELFGLINRSILMVASEAITAGSDIYAAANGKVQDEPATAGTFYRVGRALTAAGADGDVLSVIPLPPVKVIVLALPGNTNDEIGNLTISAAYSQAEVQALRAKCEELADDFRALSAALSSPAEVKWLTS